jgi:(R,R)-butanediol dehydrogenase/meso-butanediol dehydrogenase/diacetyl reductase
VREGGGPIGRILGSSMLDAPRPRGAYSHPPMRAAVFEQPGRPLAIADLPDPAPAPDELVLRVRASGVCGTDLHLTADPPGVPPGTVLGHELAGEVVALGDGVTGWRSGDRACVLPSIGCAACVACLSDDPLGCGRLRTLGQGDLPGAFAEYLRVGAADAFRLPNALDWDAGALVEPLAVGLHAVRVATLLPGERVLVLGGGPIGLAVAAWARRLGAADVVVADPLPARVALAAAFGATATVDTGDAMAMGGVADACGGPPDVVVECVGRPGMLQECVQHVRRRGRVVVAGACMTPDTVIPAMAFLKEVGLRLVVAYARADFALALRLLADGRLPGPAMATGHVDLDGFPRAFEALRAPGVQCKVILRP